MDNAKGTLKKAGKYDNYYKDEKYVKSVCGTAYVRVLKALDGLFAIKNISVPTKGRKSVEYYQSNMTKIDKKIMTNFSNVYKILHLSGYYDGITSYKVITEGFDLAYNIIETIKPTKN